MHVQKTYAKICVSFRQVVLAGLVSCYTHGLLNNVKKDKTFFINSLRARENTVSTKTGEYGGTSKDARIEVLEERIKVDSKNHESEKEKMTIEKNQTIGNLEAENDNLKSELATNKDKVKELDIANDKKTFLLKKRDHDVKELSRDIENITKIRDELQRQVSQLEEEKRHLKETYQELLKDAKGKEEEIKSLEIRISSLEKEIALVSAKEMEKEKKLLDQMKAMESKMAEMNIDAKAREIESERKMEDKLKRQEENTKNWFHEELDRRAEIEKKEKGKIHEHLEKFAGEIRQDIKECARNQTKESFVITEARNLQVHNGNQFFIQRDRQADISSRVRLPPPIDLSFPTNVDNFRNTRGIYPRCKMPTYKK